MLVSVDNQGMLALCVALLLVVVHVRGSGACGLASDVTCPTPTLVVHRS